MTQPPPSPTPNPRPPRKPPPRRTPSIPRRARGFFPRSRLARTLILLALLSTPAAFALLAAFTLAVSLLTPPASTGPGTLAATNTPRPRIAAFSPAIAQTLRDLELGTFIVARHGYDSLSDPALPAVGDQGGVNYERLLAVNPTHVLTQFGTLPRPPRLEALAAERGWILADLPLTSLDDLLTTIDRIVEIFEPATPSRFARQVAANPRVVALRELAAGDRRLFAPTEEQTLMILYSTDPPAAAGPGSFHHDAATRLGLRVLPTDGPAYQTLDAEDLLRADPAALVLLIPAPTPPGEDADAPIDPTPETLGRLAALGLRAVDEHRTAHIRDPAALLPSTRLADFAEALADLATSWHFNRSAAPASPPTPE